MARSIAVIDAETDPFEHGIYPQPFVFGFYNGKIYRKFYTVEELMNYLSDKEYIIYAHNGGKFDYFFLFDYMEAYSDVMIINGRISKFKIKDCEFRDSYNILPIPMSEFEKTEIDYNIFKKEYRDIPKNKRKIERYLKDDCINQFDLVSAFIERFGIHLTLAGCAMKTWTKISGIKPPRSTPDFYNEFKPYYYGGRVQCFEMGDIEKEFKVVDINSAYPRAMLENHPFGFEYETFTGTFKELKETYTDSIIGPGFFTVSCIALGCFPFRVKDGTTFYPEDHKVRTYNISGWELLAAIATKSVWELEIIEGHIFYDFIDFKEYVYTFYEEKKEAKEAGDKKGEIFAKILLNALYGKWAANPEDYGEYLIAPLEYLRIYDSELNLEFDDLSEDEKDVLLALSDYAPTGIVGNWGLMRADLMDEKKRYYNIATAASITGYVRAYLWRNMKKCKGVMYCDTDSIAAEDIGNIKLTKELGDWELEGEFDRAAIAGKKMYAFRYKKQWVKKDKKTGKPKRWKVASKGVRLNHRHLIRAARGDTILFNPISPSYSVHTGPRFVPRHVQMTNKTMPYDE